MLIGAFFFRYRVAPGRIGLARLNLEVPVCLGQRIRLLLHFFERSSLLAQRLLHFTFSGLDALQRALGPAVRCFEVYLRLG